MAARIRLTNPDRGYLDILDNSSFPVTMSLGDIRDISKRNGSYSRTITIVGNKESNKILGYLYDINIQQETFNVNKLQECLVEQDGIVILDNMYLQLTNVKKVQKAGSYDYDVIYEAEIKDSSSDFFSKISNLELSNLDFSEFNGTTYSVMSVTSSFNNTYLDGYKYLLPWKNPFDTTNNNHKSYSVKDFRPAIYVRQYWDKIFSSAGYTYTFDEMNNNNIQFDKLVIPYNGEDVKVEDNESINVSATASNVIQTVYNFNPNINQSNIPKKTQQIIINTEIEDDFNQYNPTTGVFSPSFNVTNPAVCKMKFFVEYEIKINFSQAVQLKPFNPNTIINGGKIIKPGFSVKNATTGVLFEKDFNSFLIPGYTSYPGGTSSLVSDEIGFEISVTDINTATSLITNTFISVADSIGNFNNFWIFKSSGGVNMSYSLTFVVKNIRMDIQPSNLSLDYGMPVKINSFIPKKIKQSEFIKSICMMYNLFIDVDRDDVTNLIIKTRDKFYDDGVVVDWTKKLAKDVNQDIKFLPELSSKKLLLTYKQDSDIYNKGYFDNVNEVYGQIEYIFENEYVKGVDKKELIFSPTPNNNTGFGANAPLIDGFTPKNNIRILLDGGERSCDSYFIKDDVNRTINTYPFLSHFDDVDTPTFDINFGMCDYYFYDVTETSSNLYNNHWRRYLGQINGGKLLTAYFNLNNVDIQKLRLNDKIRIDNSYWNINKVIEYNANARTLTKVELISIDDELELPEIKSKVVKKPFLDWGSLTSKDAVRFSNLVYNPDLNINGQYNIAAPDAKGYVSGWNNVLNWSGDGSVIGSDNYVQSPAVVNGSNNIIEASSQNIIVNGSFNYVGEGLSGVVVNGSGITASESNTTYTNNVNVVDGNLKIGDTIYGSDGFSYTGGLYIDDDYVEDGYLTNAVGYGMSWSYSGTGGTGGSVSVNFNVDEFLINGQLINNYVNKRTIGTYSTTSNITTDVSLVYTLVGSMSLYLPDATGKTSSEYIIKDRDNNASINNIYIYGTLSQLIDGSSFYKIDVNKESITVISDGSNWWII